MLFMSKARRLRVVLKPSFHILDAQGQRVQLPGKVAEFVDGRYTTEDPEEITMLFKHPYYNIEFVSVDMSEDEWKARHPEYYHPPEPVATGSLATVNVSHNPLAETFFKNVQQEGFKQAGLHKPAGGQDLSTDFNNLSNLNDIGNDLETQLEARLEARLETKLEEKLDEKLGAFLSRIEQLVAEPVKPKKTFKCNVPGCDFVGRSGVELGEHRKLVHASTQEDIEE